MSEPDPFELAEGATYLVVDDERYGPVACLEHREQHGHIRGCPACRRELAKTIEHVRQVAAASGREL